MAVRPAGPAAASSRSPAAVAAPGPARLRVELPRAGAGRRQAIYRRFVRDPGNLKGENTACAGQVAPIHTVGSYPQPLRDATLATPLPGNRAGCQALRAATVAPASVGDEVSRWPLLSDDHDLGLRGGRISFSGGSNLRITLHAVRWSATPPSTAAPYGPVIRLGDRPADRASGRRRAGQADRPVAGVR